MGAARGPHGRDACALPRPRCDAARTPAVARRANAPRPACVPGRGPPSDFHTLVRFPRIDFKRCFTLFSEYFSSFPRGTFLLSDSRPCLAFDGIYHRIRAAFSNNPTRRQRPATRQRTGIHGALTLSDVPFQGTFTRAASGTASLDYNSKSQGRSDFQVGLSPLRSPLLRGSWLVSFPPPNDMLKFSGWPCLI